MDANAKTAKQRQSIMRASEMIISRMREWRRVMTNPELKTQRAAWALGGLVTTVTGNVLHITEQVLEESKGSAKDDLTEIKRQIDDFFNHMLLQEDHVTH